MRGTRLPSIQCNCVNGLLGSSKLTAQPAAGRREHQAMLRHVVPWWWPCPSVPASLMLVEGVRRPPHPRRHQPRPGRAPGRAGSWEEYPLRGNSCKYLSLAYPEWGCSEARWGSQRVGVPRWATGMSARSSRMHYPSVASPAKALTAEAVPVPVMGLPWPPASTVDSSRPGQPFD